MGKVKKAFGAFLVPLLSVLLAFLIGGIIMAALGANPFLAVKFLFQGAFGSKAGIGTTLTKATPLIFTALCACFAYKCGVFNLGGEGQFLMGSIAAFLTCYFTGLTGFAGVLLALLAGAVAGGFWGGTDLVVAVAQGGHRDAGQQVHIFLTVHVPQPRALASDHSHGISAVGTAKQCFFLGFDGGKCVGHGQLLCWEALRHPTGHAPRQS